MTVTALELDELATDGWVPLEMDPGVAQDHARLAQRDGVGAGVVVPWARLAFTGGRPLPSGGVLLSISVDLHDKVPSRPTARRTQVDVRERGSGRPAIVTVTTGLGANDAAPFCAVVFVLMWPVAPRTDHE